MTTNDPRTSDPDSGAEERTEASDDTRDRIAEIRQLRGALDCVGADVSPEKIAGHLDWLLALLQPEDVEPVGRRVATLKGCIEWQDAGWTVLVDTPGTFANSRLNGHRGRLLRVTGGYAHVLLLDGPSEGREWQFRPEHLTLYTSPPRVEREQTFVGIDWSADVMRDHRAMEKLRRLADGMSLDKTAGKWSLVNRFVSARGCPERDDPTDAILE